MGRFRSRKDRTESLLLDYYRGKLDKKIELLQDQLELVKNTTDSGLSAKQLKQVKVKSNNIADTVADNVIKKEEKIKEIQDKIKVLKYFKQHTSKVIDLLIDDEIDKELLELCYSSNMSLLDVALELGYSESHTKRKRKELVQQLDNNLFTLFNDYPVF